MTATVAGINYIHTPPPPPPPPPIPPVYAQTTRSPLAHVHSLVACDVVNHRAKERGVDVAPKTPIGNGVVAPDFCASHVSG